MSDLAQRAPLAAGLSITDSSAADPLIELGRVTAAHGLQGWVKVQPYSRLNPQPNPQANPAQSTVLLSVREWWLDGTPTAVKAARLQGSTVIAQLQGVHDRDQAEALRGRVVCVPRSAFPAPDADEYYWVDLIGCLLYGTAAATDAPVLLGRVADVSDNGAHAVLKVARLRPDEHGNPASVHDAKGRPVELLVPFVAAHVHGVDLAVRRIDTNWPADF